MNKVNIEIVRTAADATALDDLLWRVLWEPLGLPRNIRHAFSVEGELLELAAKANQRIVGGVVAVWTSENNVELKHLAVSADAQNKGIGQHLIAVLVEIVATKGCRRIHTIARNTSAGFFRRLGFRTAPGTAPEHPVFKKQGITFELMEKIVDSGGASNPASPLH